MSGINTKWIKYLMFALAIVWFLLMTITFFVNNPIAIFALLPDILTVGVIVLAAYAIGSYVLELLRVDALLPVEDFVVASTLGLGGLSFFAMVASLFGLLNWWAIGLLLTATIVTGFNRIIGMANNPTYLFGPEDLGDERPSPLSWTQYILIALWVVALFHFCLLPPVLEQSLATTLGYPSQWLLSGHLPPGGPTPPEMVNSTTGLYALALALRGPHLAMIMSALVGALTLLSLYVAAKRFSGPITARSILLVAASLPVFSYSLLSPGDGLLMVLFQFCSFFVMLRWFEEKKRRWAITAGILLGFSMTISWLSLFFGVPMAIAAFIWALSQKKAVKFLRHLVLASAGVWLTLLPWILIHSWLFGNPLSMLHHFTALRPVPIEKWFEVVVAHPLQITFPPASEPIWRTVGPIFLVFVPFFFLSRRKNAMSWLAVILGLATLALCKNFGILLEERMIAPILLSIPAAMAAHRLASTNWKRITHLTMLYVLILGHIFFATASVEELFSSPHRFLLGIDSTEAYLERAVPYYKVASRINDSMPTDASILSVGNSGLLYFERRMTVAGGELLTNTQEWMGNADDLDRGIQRLQNRGYNYLLVNKTGYEPDIAGAPETNFTQTAGQQIETNLQDRLLFTEGNYAVYSLR